MPTIDGTPYEVDQTLISRLSGIVGRVSSMRSSGSLSPDVLGRLRRFLKSKIFITPMQSREMPSILAKRA